jgi:hypothetical protein
MAAENGDPHFRAGFAPITRLVQDADPDTNDFTYRGPRKLAWLTIPAILGIAAGGVALIVIIAAIVIVCRKRAAKPRRKSDLEFWDSNVPPSGTLPYTATTRYTPYTLHGSPAGLEIPCSPYLH